MAFLYFNPEQSMNLLKTLKALAVMGCFTAASSYASVAQLVLDGTSGDYITGGKTIDNIYSSTNPLLAWNLENFQNIGTAISPEADSLSFTYMLKPIDTSTDEYASLVFSTQALGAAIEDGTYSNAVRASSAPAGDPGLSIGYAHRGCDNSTGNFTVNQLTFANDKIDQFSASFNQSCDGGPVMHGTFTYNADATMAVADATPFVLPSHPVPEPESIALFGLGMLSLAIARLRNQAK